MSIILGNDKQAESAQQIWRERYFDLVAFTQSFSWFDERAGFYKKLAENLVKMTGADSANIRLLSSSQDSFVLYAFHGDIESAANREYGVLSAHAGRMPHLMETGEPIVFDFTNPGNDDIAWKRGAEDGYACSVTIALVGSGGVVGAADFLFHEPQDWSSEDIEWMKSLGEFVGSIVENALLSDNMIGLRMAEERRSLSNEIHDNLAQSLSVVSFEADNAIDSLAQNDEDMLRRNLDLIQRASNELELIVRSELTNLRNGFGENQKSTLGEIDPMVESFCDQWGLNCEIDRGELARQKKIPNLIMTQLARVVNEALVNVVRHAHASKVKVSYAVNDESLLFSVVDDGCGFDTSSVPSSRLGLRIMKERLGSVGALMTIESSVGAGTRIDFKIPHLV